MIFRGDSKPLQVNWRSQLVSISVGDALEKYRHEFPGVNSIPMPTVVNAYLKSVEGVSNGQTLKVYSQ